jgi:acetylornithine deacetylase/succinyl-diaminopimelate desuccinylase-like protein
MRWMLVAVLIVCPALAHDDNIPLPDRTREYLIDLIRLDTSNPPGNETRVADYLKQIADSHGIPCELVGTDPARKNFIARLKGAGHMRPLLLMAHSDVVPADRYHWSVDPFKGETTNGYIYGRGALDDKSLLASELAVMVELKRRNIHLKRDVILLSEADAEGNWTGMAWLMQHAYPKFEAEFALGQGGMILPTQGDSRIFAIQTTEKIPMHVILIAHGTAGHGSMPRSDNPLVRLSRAITRLVETDQPVHMNPTTLRYLRQISQFPSYRWLEPLLPKLENPATATAAADEIRARSPEIDAMLRTTISPTILHAGDKANEIPNTAVARVDVLRLPSESREDVLTRMRQIVNDNAIDVILAPGTQIPYAEPSSTQTALYQAMQHLIRERPEDIAVPFMSTNATDGAFLRARGVPVYGAPLFLREPGERLDGNDERISQNNLEDGVEMLWQIVMEVAGP